MCQPEKWWIGLLPLLGLWLLLNRLETIRIESDIVGRADAALAQVSGERGFSVAAGRDVSLNGWIFSEEERSNALAAAAAAGVRVVADGLSEPLAQDPYVWRATREGAAVVLAGAAPSPKERAAIVAAAREQMPGARVVDQMAYFSGAPKNFTAQARGALQVLAHLAAGGAQLRGGELTLSGKAASLAEYQAAVAQAQRPSGGLISIKADLSPPDAAIPVLEVEKDAHSPDVPGVRPGEALADAFSAEKSEKALILKGVFADDAAHEKIAGAARALFPGLHVIDEMRRGEGKVKSSVRAALGGLEQLARLNVGKFGLREHSASLSGDAGRVENAEEIKTAFIAAMPDGFSVETHVTGAAREAPPSISSETHPPVPVEPPAGLDPQACGNRLMETVLGRPLHFVYRSARLKPESGAVIDVLAAVAKKCPSAAFDIIGSAEDYIHKEYNRNLARRRAGTVATALAAEGIDPSRFNPRKPVEAADEERAKIGGVAFIVK